MNRISYIYLLLFLLFSCNSTDKQISDEDSLQIDIDLFSDIAPPIKKMKYIPLETNKNCLINSLDKIIYKHHKFYVFDKKGKAIYVFDDGGKLIHTIHQVGNGPGEYTEPLDIDVDSAGNLYVCNHTNKTLLKFPFDNMEKGEAFIETGEYYMDFAITDSNYIYLSDVIRKGEIEIKLARLTLNQKEISVLEKNEYPSGNKIPRASRHYLFRSTNGSLYHYKRFSNRIKFVEGNEGGKDIVFMSKKTPSSDRLDKWAESPNTFMSEYEYLRDVSACYENRDHILIAFETNPQVRTVINKRSKKIYNVNMLSHRDCGYLGKIEAADENYFVSSCSPTSNFLKRVMIEDEENERLLADLTEDSNPVLVLFNFE